MSNFEAMQGLITAAQTGVPFNMDGNEFDRANALVFLRDLLEGVASNQETPDHVIIAMAEVTLRYGKQTDSDNISQN